MGSLALAYGIKGLGSGIIAQQEQEAELERQTQQQEATTAREVQLQRMRNKAAQERTDSEITANRELQKERYKQEADQLRSRIEAEAGESSKQQAHEIQVEEMRQKAQANIESMRLDVKEPVFQRETIPATREWNPITNSYDTSERRDLIHDKLTGVSYDQQSIGGEVVFIPTTAAAKPTKDHIDAGRMATKWLTTAPDRETQISRLFQFQKIFRYVPPEYFATYGNRSAMTRQQQSATTTTPANPPATAPATAQ